MFSVGGTAPGLYTMAADGSNRHIIPNTVFDDLQPVWVGPSGPVVQVVDENHIPVPNAEVDLASASDPTNFSLLGTTNSDGKVSLITPLAGDHIVARFLVDTGVSNKGSHDGWAHHVYLTNVDQNSDGTQTDYTITDPSLQVQTVTIKKTDTEIGINLVGSVEYNATTGNLQDIAAGLTAASKLLLDVTDGQMFFEKVTLYENGQNFQDADIQYRVWPLSVNAGNGQGPVGLTDPRYHMLLPGPGYNGLFWTGSWQQPIAYTLLDKVFGYYGLGAYNEADYLEEPLCDVSRYSEPLDSRASLMAQGLPKVSFSIVGGTPVPTSQEPLFFTEICDDSDHSHSGTQQENTLHEIGVGYFHTQLERSTGTVDSGQSYDQGCCGPRPLQPHFTAGAYRHNQQVGPRDLRAIHITCHRHRRVLCIASSIGRQSRCESDPSPQRP